MIERITAKMIHRHPHVFGEAQAHTASDVLTHWERAKQAEKQRASILDGIPVDLPALAKAARLSKKAARVGYDFPHRAMLFDKLREEIDELRADVPKRIADINRHKPRPLEDYVLTLHDHDKLAINSLISIFELISAGAPPP